MILLVETGPGALRDLVRWLQRRVWGLESIVVLWRHSSWLISGIWRVLEANLGGCRVLFLRGVERLGWVRRFMGFCNQVTDVLWICIDQPSSTRYAERLAFSFAPFTNIRKERQKRKPRSSMSHNYDSSYR